MAEGKSYRLPKVARALLLPMAPSRLRARQAASTARSSPTLASRRSAGGVPKSAVNAQRPFVKLTESAEAHARSRIGRSTSVRPLTCEHNGLKRSFSRQLEGVRPTYQYPWDLAIGISRPVRLRSAGARRRSVKTKELVDAAQVAEQ